MSRFLRSAGLALLAAVTLLLSYLALTRDMTVDSSDADRQPIPATEQPSSSASAAPVPPSESVPEISEQVRADFSTAGELPARARVYDNPATGSPLEVRQGFLTHDPPKAPVSIGSLEVRLSSPVQRLGARVVFADQRSGTVNLVAWTSSLVNARRAGQPVPSSGLRLVVSPTEWRLTVYDKSEFVLASDSFVPVAGPQTFEVYRSESQVWVVDPRGKVTHTRDPLFGELIGPWACWQVVEDRPRQIPARIQAVWAG